MLVYIMLWPTVGVVFGSVTLGIVAALGESTRSRWHAHRRSLHSSSVGPVTHGDWVFGDAKLAAQLFTTLCRLRRQLQPENLSPPDIQAILVGYDRVVLRLATPTPDPPIAPWPPGIGNTYRRFWVLDTADAQDWEPGPAPYPVVTPVGSYDGWTVLVNLAQAPGVVSLVGDDQAAQGLLRTVASGLASGPWSRKVRIVAAGFEDRFAVPEPGRIAYFRSAAEAVDHVDHTTADQRLVLLLARPPERDTLARLDRLIGDRDQPGVVLCAGRVASAGWVFHAEPDGRLHLNPLGLVVNSGLPASHPMATQTADPAPTGWHEAVRTLTAPVLTDRTRNRRWPANVRVNVLGPLEVVAPFDIDTEHRPALTDLVVAAAMRPDGLPRSLVSALLPRADEVSTLVRRLHDWLGADETGLPRLRERRGAWRLSPDVRVDWHLFRDLVSGTEPDEHEWPRLATALGMIRGELLSEAELGPVTRKTLPRYAADIHGQVIRAVRRAAELASAGGDAANVEWALRQGLTMLPRVEGLWRSLLMFQQEHNRSAVDQTVDEMFSALAVTPGRTRLERPTRELLTRLGVRPHRQRDRTD